MRLKISKKICLYQATWSSKKEKNEEFLKEEYEKMNEDIKGIKEKKVREILDFTYLKAFVKKLKVELPNYRDLANFLSRGYRFYEKLDLTKTYFRINIRYEDSLYVC